MPICWDLLPPSDGPNIDELMGMKKYRINVIKHRRRDWEYVCEYQIGGIWYDDITTENEDEAIAWFENAVNSSDEEE